jgi:dimethylargininase
MLTRAIVLPPAPNFAEGLTTSDLGAPNYERALEQHEAYCAALEQCGLTLTRLEADERYPDSCFVEDTAILVGPPDGDENPSARQDDVESQTHPLTQVVLTRPGASSRVGEVASIRTVMAEFFPALSEIRSPGTLDGGDVCEAGSHFFIGISERTSEAGAQQLAELLARQGYASSFVDISGDNEMKSVPRAVATGSTSPRILHLKSGLAYLGDNRLAVTEALANRAEFRGYDLIRVNSDEAYAANCVRVNDYLLLTAGYPKFEAELRELGYQTIALELREFQKMDGGLSCLSLRF